jgi:hypothetical protein
MPTRGVAGRHGRRCRCRRGRAVVPGRPRRNRTRPRARSSRWCAPIAASRSPATTTTAPPAGSTERCSVLPAPSGANRSTSRAGISPRAATMTGCAPASRRPAATASSAGMPAREIRCGNSSPTPTCRRASIASANGSASSRTRTYPPHGSAVRTAGRTARRSSSTVHSSSATPDGCSTRAPPERPLPARPTGSTRAPTMPIKEPGGSNSTSRHEPTWRRRAIRPDTSSSPNTRRRTPVGQRVDHDDAGGPLRSEAAEPDPSVGGHRRTGAALAFS